MVVTAVEGHRLWAPSYDTAPNPLPALEDRVLPAVLQVGQLSGLPCIDVACGTGRWTERLAARGANVFGVDLCAEMLAYAGRKPGLAGRLLLADAGQLPIAGEVAGLTLCSLAVGYFPSLDAAVSELARITRPGGRVVIGDLHPASVAAGWTRSFRANGGAYEMRHFAHSVSDILRAAGIAGLELESQQDAYFGAPEEPLFRAAGKLVPDAPAIWIASWRK